MLYQQIAQSIAQQIRAGTFRAGDRVSSVRRMCQNYGVSKNTIIQAYSCLEAQGLIEAKPKSGFYVKAQPLLNTLEPQKIDNFPIISSKISLKEIRTILCSNLQDPGIVPLGAACPSPEFFPYYQLNQAFRTVLRKEPLHSSIFEFGSGNEALLRQIARRSMRWGGKLSPTDLWVTSGGMDAIYLALQAIAKPGDIILTESPTFFGILETLSILKMRILEIPCDPKVGIDLEVVRKSLRKDKFKAAIVIPSFHNPLGSLMPEDHKKEFVQLLQSKEIPIIEVDVYGDLAYNGNRPKNMKAFDQDERILLCSSVSKILAPGLRVGWLVPGRYRLELSHLARSSSITTPSLVQRGLAEYFKYGGYDRHLRKVSQLFRLQTQKVREAVFYYFPKGTRVTCPEGGFILWVELPKSIDALELYRLALKKKISISPGNMFSMSGKYRNYVRLNCGNIWTSKIEEAIMTLGRLCKG